MFQKIFLSALTVALLFLAASSAVSQCPKYLTTDLGTLGGADTYPVSGGISNSGQVVGMSVVANSCCQTHAFLWQNGVMTDLGVLGRYPNGTDHSLADGINNSGQIVGASSIFAHQETAVLWQNGLITDLGTLPGFDDYLDGSQATGINNTGQVVGISAHNGGSTRAFLWQNGAMTDLGTLPGENFSYAYAINNSSGVVGYSYSSNLVFVPRAFLWQNGVMVDLGTLGGASMGTAINDLGQVVGYSNNHAFRWQNGSIFDLGTLGGSFSFPNAINNSGQIVGQSNNPSGTQHAFIFSNGVMTDLNTLIPSGITLDNAFAINDSGQIVAGGFIGGHRRALLLTPYVPSYTIRLLYDPTKAHKSGSTIPIKIQVLDMNGDNVSSPSLNITAVGISASSSDAPGQLADDSGNANPDSNFRYDSSLAGYIYNLSTAGLSGNATYKLYFRAGNDFCPYTVEFQIK